MTGNKGIVRDWQQRNSDSEYKRNYSSMHSIKGHALRRKKQLVHHPPFGYLVEEGKYKINHNPYKHPQKTVYEIAREIIEYFIKNQSYGRTVKYFIDLYGSKKNPNDYNDFPNTRTSFKRWLENQTLDGHTVYFQKKRKIRRIPVFNDENISPEIYYNTHEPLITKKERNTLNMIMEDIKNSRKSNRSYSVVNPLAGRLYCICGAKMRIRVKTNKDHSKQYNYLCCTRAYQRDNCAATCPYPASYGLKLEMAIESVINTLKEKSQEIGNFAYPKTDINIDSPEIKTLEEQINRLISYHDPDLESVIATKKQKLNNLRYEQQISSNDIDINDKIEKLHFYSQSSDFWKLATNEDLKLIFVELVHKVVCDRGQVIVTLKI